MSLSRPSESRAKFLSITVLFNKKRTPIRTNTTVKMEGPQPQPGEKRDFHQSAREKRPLQIRSAKLGLVSFALKCLVISFGNPFSATGLGPRWTRKIAEKEFIAGSSSAWKMEQKSLPSVTTLMEQRHGEE